MNRAVEIMNNRSFIEDDQELIENLVQCNRSEQLFEQGRQIRSMQRLNQFIDESHRNILNASYQYPDYPQQYQINRMNILNQQENFLNLPNQQPNHLSLLSPMAIPSSNPFYIQPEYQLTNYSQVYPSQSLSQQLSQPLSQSYYIDNNMVMYPQPPHDHAYFRVVTSQNNNQPMKQLANQRQPLSQLDSQINSQISDQLNSQSDETITNLDDPKERANKRQKKTGKSKNKSPDSSLEAIKASSQEFSSQSSSESQISLPDHLKEYFQNDDQKSPLFSKNFIIMQTSKLRYNLRQFIFQNNFDNLGINELNDLNKNPLLMNLFSNQVKRIQEKNSIVKAIRFKNRKLKNIGLRDLSSQANKLNFYIRFKKHKENVIKLEAKINRLKKVI